MKFTRTNIIILILIITALTLIVPSAIRGKDNPNLIGEESYYHLRTAQTIESSGFGWKDNLLASSPDYKPNLIHIILAYIPSKELFMLLIPILFGFLSVILFYLILSSFNIGEKHKFFSSVLLILSPPFMHSFTIYSNYTFLIFFNLLFILLYLRKKYIFSFAVILPVLFISLPSILVSLFSLILVAGLNKRSRISRLLSRKSAKKDKSRLKVFIFSLLLISIALYIAVYISSFIPNKIFFLDKNIVTSTISDFGATIGITVFHALLAVIGLALLWAKKREYRYYYIGILLSFVLSAYFETILIFLNFAVSFFAAYAFLVLYQKKWEIINLKNITLMLVIYGILFSSISFGTRLVNSPPSADEAEALTWLRGEPDGVALSHYSNGYLLEFFSEKQATLDGRLYFSKDTEKMLSDTNNIFSSRNLQETKIMLNQQDISYIYIDNEMKDGMVWEKRNEGLLFLLDYSDEFERIYINNGIEIWKVLNITQSS